MARIAGINIPQNKVVSIALTYIHGIGPHSSKNICKTLYPKLNAELAYLVNNVVLPTPKPPYKAKIRLSVKLNNSKATEDNFSKLLIS